MINYKVLGYLHKSENGSSTVLKVQDKDNKEIYALKLVGPIKNKLNSLIFKREINALKALNKYDDIVTIFDYDAKIVFNKVQTGAILLEYVDGKTLNQVDSKILSQLEKMDLCLRICKAIANAHNNGILHRDIKPQNIMYQNGKVKIIDFGSSKIKGIVETETTMPLFSHNYSAPEVVAGGDTLESSDIYSLGIIFSEVLLGIKPSTTLVMLREIQEANILSDIKELLISMIQPEPQDRLDDIEKAIDIFTKIIGELNVNSHKFVFYIDSSKLQDLKRQYVVENNMTMAQFLNVFLPKEFNSMYGILDRTNEIYKFVGDNIYFECIIDKRTGILYITKIYEIHVDRRVKMQKLYMEVKGKIEFINSSGLINHNNRQLSIMLANYAEELKSYEKKTKLFDQLFGKWKQSLKDSIESTKSRIGKVSYTNYILTDKQLTITIKKYTNNSIDNIDNETRYIFEEVINNRGGIRTHQIGSFEDVLMEDNKLNMVISLNPKTKRSVIRSSLEAKQEIYEDYNHKILSFKRQISAILALRNDECSSKSLKDIILELEVPTSTQSIRTMKYYAQELNDSQKLAVNKALNSDCISMIQGPPGTGKTKVINEILNQIILKNENASELPKILVVSQSNTAVDNVLEGLDLINSSVNVRVVRIGDKEKVSRIIADQFMVEAIREDMFSSLKEKSSQYVSDKLEIYNDTSEREKWLTIKEIQEDWCKRCGDYESLKYHIVSSASITAGTCIGFLSNEFVRDIDFDYVIVDEAAKATTPELLVSIIKAKKIILVGDQKQLPPFADQGLSNLAVELAQNPKYRLFDILFLILPETHRQVLTTQYRMIRNIGDLISQVFYDGTINTGIDDDERKHGIPYYGDYSIIWYNTSTLVSKKQKEESGGSFSNSTENKIIKPGLPKKYI